MTVLCCVRKWDWRRNGEPYTSAATTEARAAIARSLNCILTVWSGWTERDENEWNECVYEWMREKGKEREKSSPSVGLLIL